MASTGLNDFNQFTVSNQGITDLRELLFLTVLQMGSINETMDIMVGVQNGSRLGGVGELAPIGLPSNGCDPQWKASKISTLEKMWELGAYEVAENICYADLEATMVQFAMRKGTEIADLTGTDYMDVIVEPLLRQAMEKMIWRLMWFGDKDAKNTGLEEGEGGVITAGVDPALFKVCDGLFKRIFAITAKNAAQRVAIEANTKTTYADQIAWMRGENAATGVMDQLVYNAPMELRQKSDRVVLATQSFADALAIDIKRTKGSDLQWQSMFGGLVSATQYNGERILALPIWDEMIRTFEDTGEAWTNPHRVVFASKNTLKGGVESRDMIASLDIFFDKLTQKNYMLAKDKVGTLTWEDNLIMAAY